MHVMYVGRYETDLQPFWKRTGKCRWAKQALQAKEQRPWGPESQRQRKKEREGINWIS